MITFVDVFLVWNERRLWCYYFQFRFGPYSPAPAPPPADIPLFFSSPGRALMYSFIRDVFDTGVGQERWPLQRMNRVAVAAVGIKNLRYSHLSGWTWTGAAEEGQEEQRKRMIPRRISLSLHQTRGFVPFRMKCKVSDGRTSKRSIKREFTL